MKKTILLFVLLILTAGFVYSQSLEQIREEANPTGYYIDNSDYAKLWEQVVRAKNSGNIELYNSLSARINSEFPEKFKSENAGFNSPLQGVSSDNRPPFNNYSPDWGAGDIKISAGSISTGTPGNPRSNFRTIRLQTDSTGVLFAGFMNGTRDTLNFFRSTNNGANWTRITFYYLSGGFKFHSFDMFVTDSLSTSRIGCAASVTPSNASYAGDLYWISFKADGTGGRSAIIKSKVDGKGYVGPAIVSDGYTYPASTTYWYVAYQQIDTTTGVTNLALLNMSTNWGYSWVVDTARGTYNDYELDVEYSHFPGVDTIYVNLTNNLTAANENMRLRYVGLSGIGTATTWKQFNTGASSDPEYCGILAANRQTNEMGVSYTKSTASVENIYYAYVLNGISPWVTDVALTSASVNENLSALHCSEGQGAFRIAYHVSGGSYDTIVYKSTFSLGSGFSGHQVVNVTNSSASGIKPDVAGFRTGASSFAGGVMFAGSTSNLWFDASNLTPTDIKHENTIAENYELRQNFPNPFNPVTTIRFSLPKNEFVSIRVYDITGREAAVLVNSQLNAGSHTVSFDAKNLSSGIYFYKMISGNYSEIRKMMLIK